MITGTLWQISAGTTLDDVPLDLFDDQDLAMERVTELRAAGRDSVQKQVDDLLVRVYGRDAAQVLTVQLTELDLGTPVYNEIVIDYDDEDDEDDPPDSFA